MSKISSTSNQVISPTTELIEAPERVNAFRDMKFGPNDFLYEDLPWMLERTPIYKEVQKKNPNFEFKKTYGGVRRASSNDSSRLDGSEDEGKKSDTVISFDDNKNADSQGNETKCSNSSMEIPVVSEEQTRDSTEKIVDSSPSIQNNDDQVDPCMKKYNELSEREPVHINTAEKVAHIEKVLQAQLTAEDHNLMPTYIPEYESVFDGPWILGRMPPYSDSSIPKGPTPPSPIQYQFRQKH